MQLRKIAVLVGVFALSSPVFAQSANVGGAAGAAVVSGACPVTWAGRAQSAASRTQGKKHNAKDPNDRTNDKAGSRAC